VLPPELVSQIAAGEVLERPASAVKELIENALDAEATRCDVSIEGGGLTLISVADDGSGMSAEDALLALERHATSKLNAFPELYEMTTFGFRGEALPSIASVSKLTLTTRTRDGEAGVELKLDGSTRPELRPVGCAVGTHVEVRELFHNVPARRKFLRSTGTEAGHVSDVVEAAALARPEVTFTLRRDGRRVREWLRTGSREARVADAHPGERLASCRGERGPLRLEAFLSPPERARTGAGGLSLFVNGRPVRDRALAVTVAQAYGSVLEKGRYPRGVVYLDLNPRLLDVNVHPQKSEVRFADPRAVTDAVYGILARALAGAFSLPSSPRGGAPRPAAQADTAIEPALLAEAAAAEISLEAAAAPGTDAAGLIFVRDSLTAPIRPGPQTTWSSLRFVAQLRQTYLLCEGSDGLYVLDQHAAAERVTFTRLRKQYQSRQVACQALLFPIVLEVGADEVALVEQRGREIAEVGLDLRVRGPGLLSVHAIPKLLQRGSPERLVHDLLGELARSGGRGFSDAVDLALATMACHGSIRAGDALTESTAAALLSALDLADFAGHCPHGRPVVTFTSWAELERRVGRR
jgi:DNA mismatch repair protein MutL